jgi:hypothetical protein
VFVSSKTTLPLGIGNRWAVLVGVNEYLDKTNYGQLSVCVKDVEATHEQFVAGGFDPDRVRLLTDHTPDELPTKGNILASLKAVADATEPDDLLLFYYSGHGDEMKGESYLVAHDGQRLVLDDTAVPVSRVKEIMESARARAKVILLDACHSGADIGGKGARPMSAEFIRRVFEEAEGLAILASCKQGQLSYQWQENKRSVFTHFLLEALKGDADRDEKGFVSVQDASRHVTDGVKLWASQRKVSQTPTFQCEVAGGDIVLTKYRGSPPSWLEWVRRQLVFLTQTVPIWAWLLAVVTIVLLLLPGNSNWPTWLFGEDWTSRPTITAAPINPGVAKDYLNQVFVMWTVSGELREDSETDGYLLSAFHSLLVIHGDSRPVETMQMWIEDAKGAAAAAIPGTTISDYSFLEFDVSGPFESLTLEESYYRLWEHVLKESNSDLKASNMAAIRLALIASVGEERQRELLDTWDR